MKQLKMYPTSLNDRYLDEAVECLEQGGVIIYPTDTLYALGCDALNNGAIERLCKIKGVDPRKQTLSVVCSGISMASEYARVDNEAFRILRRNLPGPFTFILPASTTLPKIFKGRKEVGIRVPANPIASALADRLGHPLLSTSIPQDEDGVDPATVALEYEGVASLLIDGGEGEGIPSTVVDITDSRNPEIVREGKGELC
ncbi:MAG: threonylcarbamoyl-AMP synthase [Duncaniella sp.]|nr:threonylcarbamoyl-AMP synthase [Duncaniella sp.]MDE5751710.1 threonylcarbamoyl-AMP synthase [Duncaniella sp.]MDE5919402.1 threonylcarbamoyl-AMP synthase [Duncaniella sp.]MDE6171240.1 threonylcarbamoyl-AMP synthase [Duncaniella sp.]MDE6327114.1 threonylcarbamoyl-AMP synthase [Duncaniella sp.]